MKKEQDVDVEIDEQNQRELDDRIRAASGISPEVLAMQEAFAEGIRAGNFGHGPSLNPYADDTPKHHEWNRGRMAAISARFNARRYA